MRSLPEKALVILHQRPKWFDNLGGDGAIAKDVGVVTRVGVATHKGVFARQQQFLGNAPHIVAVVSRQRKQVELQGVALGGQLFEFAEVVVLREEGVALGVGDDDILTSECRLKKISQVSVDTSCAQTELHKQVVVAHCEHIIGLLDVFHKALVEVVFGSQTDFQLHTLGHLLEALTQPLLGIVAVESVDDVGGEVRPLEAQLGKFGIHRQRVLRIAAAIINSPQQVAMDIVEALQKVAQRGLFSENAKHITLDVIFYISMLYISKQLSLMEVYDAFSELFCPTQRIARTSIGALVVGDHHICLLGEVVIAAVEAAVVVAL